MFDDPIDEEWATYQRTLGGSLARLGASLHLLRVALADAARPGIAKIRRSLRGE